MEQLNFKQHIEKPCGKKSPLFGMLYKLKFYLPSRILKSINHAFIHSNFQYLLIVWGSAQKPSLKPVQILQNRALKSVFNKGPLFGTVELYHTVAKGLLPVRALYEYQVSCFVFKVMQSTVYSNLTFGGLNCTKLGLELRISWGPQELEPTTGKGEFHLFNRQCSTH
jgi:hypothetical protein